MANKKLPTMPKKAQVISVAGAYPRSGCTHFCMVLAHFLASRHFQVAVVECNDSEQFAELAETEQIEISNDGIFSLHGCHYYIYDDSLLSVVNGGYDYVVVDYGCIQNVQRDKYYLSDHCILTATARPWELSILQDILDQELEYGCNRMLLALMFSFEDTKTQAKIKQKLSFGGNFYFVPYHSNPIVDISLEGIEPFLHLQTEETTGNKNILRSAFSKFQTKFHQNTQVPLETKSTNNIVETPPVPEEKEEENTPILDEAKEKKSDITVFSEDVSSETIEVEKEIFTENNEVATVEEIESQMPSRELPEELPEVKKDEEIPEKIIPTEQEVENLLPEEAIVETQVAEPEIHLSKLEQEVEKAEETVENQEKEAFDMFVTPIHQDVEQTVQYVDDKMPNYKGQHEMCYICKTFQLEDVHGTYVKFFRFIAYPLEYHTQKPVRMIICVSYNYETFVAISPENRISVSLTIDNEDLLFNGQFKENRFDVFVSSMDENMIIKEMKTLQSQQYAGLPDTFPKCTGYHTQIQNHDLTIYPLYPRNARNKKCMFMYQICYPDGEKMIGCSSSDEMEALIPIQNVLQTVSCSWVRLGTDAYCQVIF